MNFQSILVGFVFAMVALINPVGAATQLGEVSAHIENNRLVSFNKSDLFTSAADPVTTGGDWAYDSWRISRGGGTITMEIPGAGIPTGKDTFLKLVYAGFGDDTLINVRVNGKRITTRRPVAGHAWGNPDIAILDITKVCAENPGANLKVEIELDASAPMVLFFKSLALQQN